MMPRCFLPLISCVLLVWASGASAATSPALLQGAVQNWIGERDHWAFTQRAIEYQENIPHERLERYDPSRPGDERWALLAVDGKPPTPQQWQKWAEKKFKRHHHKVEMPLGELFDFHEARIVAETPKLVRFDVPIRSDKNWLFPVSKVDVRVTINKDTRAVEHLTAHVREPFKVLLGLARVTGGDLDLNFLPIEDNDPIPASAKPTGTAHVSVSRFGERIDFTWSDFKRVVPYREPDVEEAVSTNSRGDQ